MADLITIEEAIEMMADPVGDPIGGIEGVLAEAQARHAAAMEPLRSKVISVGAYADAREAEVAQIRQDFYKEEERLKAAMAHQQRETDRQRAEWQRELAELQEHLRKTAELHSQELRSLREERVSLQSRNVELSDTRDTERLEFLEKKLPEIVEREREAQKLATSSAESLDRIYREWLPQEASMEGRLALKRELPRLISRLRGIPEATVILPGSKSTKPSLAESEWATANP